jgi:hypothetical protein
MMLPSALISLLFVAIASPVYAVPGHLDAKRDPGPGQPKPITIPIVRRSGFEKRNHSVDEWVKLAHNIKAKYAPSSHSSRSLVTVSTTNQQADTSYFGTLHVGTPPVAYNVILDTGSAFVYLFEFLFLILADPETVTFGSAPRRALDAPVRLPEHYTTLQSLRRLDRCKVASM